MDQSKNSDNLHTCEGVAECPIDDSDTLQNVKSRVKELAKLSACKEIDNYIYLFLKNKNFMLPSEEISSISVEISNVIDVKYQLQNSDNDNMLIHASVIAQFDDNDILNHLDKFFREKSALVEQNEELKQKLANLEMQNDKYSREISSLAAQNEKLNRQLAELKSQHDRDSREISSLTAQNEELKHQIAELNSRQDKASREISSLRTENKELKRKIAELESPRVNSQSNNNQLVQKLKDSDKIALANQKRDDAWKLYCKKDYRGAIKLYSEAIELNPNAPKFYYYRSLCYKQLGETAKAQADFDKAKQLGW